jgi:transcriptional regulator with XRE-family HTH domain
VVQSTRGRGSAELAEQPADALIRVVGRRAREIRLDKRLSQAEVASRLRMATPNLQRIEAGRQNLTLSTLARLAQALGVAAHELLREPSRRRAP